jgi:coenzyme F420-reducing hydrogenase gamma subunit
VNKKQLVEVVLAFLHRRKPLVSAHSVCVECKLRGNPCVMVAHGTPCLGPVTQAGCGAICPAYNRGCYGCFGPMETPNTAALSAQWGAMGVPGRDIMRAYRSFNAYAPPFREESDKHEP